ncbi:hypothetical protein TWF506_009231 [Arthrobotrys conoides]|uniref:Nephrocystin 3-like N-terminal domain-containing protein n=1 Tax=Arthrobotrys conoides TaxID=74498 RepID=A0AAN8NN79_9PEZI
MLKQLARQQCSLPEDLKELYDSCRSTTGARPTVEKIVTVLSSVVALYSRVFIVVDAIGECQRHPNYCREKLLSTIFHLHAVYGINIFVASRHIKEIIEDFMEQGSSILEVRVDDEDLRLYLDSRINQTNRPMLRNNRETIKQEIVNVFQGIFLLERLHFESVENKTAPKKLKTALERLSTGEGEAAYSIAYAEAMERIDSQNLEFKSLARRVLAWVVCAERPLSQLELRYALAFRAQSRPK